MPASSHLLVIAFSHSAAEQYLKYIWKNSKKYLYYYGVML